MSLINVTVDSCRWKKDVCTVRIWYGALNLDPGVSTKFSKHINGFNQTKLVQFVHLRPESRAVVGSEIHERNDSRQHRFTCKTRHRPRKRMEGEIWWRERHLRHVLEEMQKKRFSTFSTGVSSEVKMLPAFAYENSLGLSLYMKSNSF